MATQIGNVSTSVAGGISLGWGSNEGGSSQQFSNGERSSAGATVDTASHTDDVLVDVPSGTGTSDWIGSVNAWESDGLRLDVIDTATADRQFFTLLVEEDRVCLYPDGIASGEAWGTPTLTAVLTVTPTGIVTAEAWGTPTVSPQPSTLSPTGIASGEAWGTPTLTTFVTISPSGVASLEAWGTPTITAGSSAVSPSGIGSGEAWGTPSLTTFITLSPSAIPSEEAWGTPTLTADPSTLSPLGIGSEEAWGTPTLESGAPTIEPVGITSEEAWGTPTLTLGDVTLLVAGIASEEAWGTPTVQAGVLVISPDAIASEEAWGTPVVGFALVTVFPLGIASEEAWGLPTVLGGQRTIEVLGIPSEEAWGLPFLMGGVIPVTMKKLIFDALQARAKSGTFIAAQHDADADVLVQGLQVPPSSVEANEISAVFRTETRHGRAVVQDRAQWQWQLILRFEQEVITEPFEEALQDDPIVICRDPLLGLDRQITMKLLDSTINHPPRIGASNGTEVKYRFTAELSAK